MLKKNNIKKIQKIKKNSNKKRKYKKKPKKIGNKYPIYIRYNIIANIIRKNIEKIEINNTKKS